MRFCLSDPGECRFPVFFFTRAVSPLHAVGVVESSMKKIPNKRGITANELHWNFNCVCLDCTCDRCSFEHRFFPNDQPHVLEGTPYTGA